MATPLNRPVDVRLTLSCKCLYCPIIIVGHLDRPGAEPGQADSRSYDYYIGGPPESPCVLGINPGDQQVMYGIRQAVN